MNIDLANVNFFAVLVAAIAVFLIGGVWYQALFGRMWIKLHNFTDEDVKRMQQRYSAAVFFPTMLAAYLLISFAIALLAESFDLHTWAAGLGLGAVLWLIVAAIGVTAHITSDRHIGLYAIDTAYQFVIFLVAGAIIGAWR